MIPKPICRSLWYIFGWKTYIEKHLTDQPLEMHSKYNSFIISVENGDVKLRVKKLPQDEIKVPRAGIRLLKEGHQCGPIGIADFRVERLNFDQIMRGLHIFLSGLPLDRTMKIQTSWDALRKKLCDLPSKVDSFPSMKLTNLPKFEEDTPVVPEALVQTNDIPEIRGELYPENPVLNMQLEDEVQVGMDICVYTKEEKSRPWLGRVVKLLGEKKFIIHWYTRKTSKSTLFKALNNSDGSPSLTELDNDTVMFWMVSEPQSRKENSFSVSSYWLQTIMLEYKEMDGKL